MNTRIAKTSMIGIKGATKPLEGRGHRGLLIKKSGALPLDTVHRFGSTRVIHRTTTQLTDSRRVSWSAIASQETLCGRSSDH